MDEKPFKFGGSLLYEGEDNSGRIQIVDTRDKIRSLHFDSRAKQSAVNLNEPHQLNLNYSQAMTVSLLFVKKIETALCLGLGGGSIPKFLHRYFPNCAIDTVESRMLVINLAYKFFALPNDSRLQVHHQKGENFLENCSPHYYDLIFVDMFSQFGVSPAVLDRRFASSLKSVIHSDGVITMNLWTQPKQVYCSIQNNLRSHFDNGVLELPIAGRINCILFGLNADNLNFNHRQLRKKARVFESVFGIDYPLFVQDLIKCNARQFAF